MEKPISRPLNFIKRLSRWLFGGSDMLAYSRSRALRELLAKSEGRKA